MQWSILVVDGTCSSCTDDLFWGPWGCNCYIQCHDSSRSKVFNICAGNCLSVLISWLALVFQVQGVLVWNISCPCIVWGADTTCSWVFRVHSYWMQAAGSSTTVVIIHEAVWCHIPEDNPYGHHHGNCKLPV